MDAYTHIFLLGIKGAGMANIALILKKMGKSVTGSDTHETFITEELLRKNSIHSLLGFDPDILPKNIDLFVYSAAHGGRQNPQAVEAIRRNIPIMHQAEFLGLLMESFETKIAVSGCHGKTTTTSLLAKALINLGAEPSYFVGAPSFDGIAGGDYRGSDYFVIEADEYGVNPPIDKTPKFLSLRPNQILCTNVDFDHPDIYSSLDEVKNAYLTFFKDRKLFLCIDDPVTKTLLPSMQNQDYTTYGLDLNADLHIKQIQHLPGGTIFSARYKDRELGDFSLRLYGKKNVLNAAGVIAVLLQNGFPPEKIAKSIGNFEGAARRFSLIFKKNETYLFDDYAHHPHEISTTLQAARDRFPDRKIVAIFQPHTFSRTQAFYKDFASALATADLSFVLPIFPSARENTDEYTVTSQLIQEEAEAHQKMNVKSVKDFEHLRAQLDTFLKPGNIILTMGAGDVYKAKDDIISLIEQKA